MMDKKLVFCEAKAVTASFNSDAIDFIQVKPTTGLNDRPLYLCVAIPTALSGEGSVDLKLQESADNSIFSDVIDFGSPVERAYPMPLEHKRYLRLVATVNGNVSAGAITAYLSDVINVPMDTPKAG